MSLVTLQSAENTINEDEALTVLHGPTFRRVGTVVPSLAVIMTRGVLLN
jgi:hypothetical protein